MYARFLFGWPATPEYAPLNDDIEEVDPVFQSVLTKLIRLPAEAESGEFAPRIIPLRTMHVTGSKTTEFGWTT